MGKNTMIRKAIRGHLENNPHLEKYVNDIIMFSKITEQHVRASLITFKIYLLTAPSITNHDC